jgi:hypothetical protein
MSIHDARALPLGQTEASTLFSDAKIKGYTLRYPPELLAPVLQIVHRVIATFLIQQAGLQRTEAATGAVTLIQRFGSAANLNIHLHCFVLDSVYHTTEACRFSAPCAPRSPHRPRARVFDNSLIHHYPSYPQVTTRCSHASCGMRCPEDRDAIAACLIPMLLTTIVILAAALPLPAFQVTRLDPSGKPEVVWKDTLLAAARRSDQLHGPPLAG